MSLSQPVTLKIAHYLLKSQKKKKKRLVQYGKLNILYLGKNYKYEKYQNKSL